MDCNDCIRDAKGTRREGVSAPDVIPRDPVPTPSVSGIIRGVRSYPSPSTLPFDALLDALLNGRREPACEADLPTSVESSSAPPPPIAASSPSSCKPTPPPPAYIGWSHLTAASRPHPWLGSACSRRYLPIPMGCPVSGCAVSRGAATDEEEDRLLPAVRPAPFRCSVVSPPPPPCKPSRPPSSLLLLSASRDSDRWPKTRLDGGGGAPALRNTGSSRRSIGPPCPSGN